MKTKESYSIWLTTAYRLFAENGPEKLSVKELAKNCGLPRTNFYYYFDNKNELIDKIIELHFTSTTEILNVELEKRLHVYIPDLYVILYDFKLGLQFTKQLFCNRENQKFNQAYTKGVALSVNLIVPKFKAFFNIDLPNEEVKALWFILVDTWYSRLYFNNFSVVSLIESCYEIMDTIKPLIEKSNCINYNTPSLSTPLSK